MTDRVEFEVYALQKSGAYMKLLAAIIILIMLSGCVVGDCRDPLKIPMLPKRDAELAHKCRMDPYKPECSVN
jgi:hypothetical protein